MLLGSVCAGVGLCAPRSLSRQAAWYSAPAGSRAAGGPQGVGDTAVLPWSLGQERPPSASLFPWGPGPTALLPPHWPVAESSLHAQVRGTPAHVRSVTPLSPIIGQSVYVPSLASRLHPAQPKPPSGQSLGKTSSPLPTRPGGLQPPLGKGCPGQVGDSRRVPDCTPRSRRAAAAGAPTQAAEGWQAEAPAAPPSVLAPRALRGPLCVHLPAGMASFDAIAPTQWPSPPC